jgi:hypothetical protein
MINKGFRNMVIASVLTAALVFAGAGCNEKLTESSDNATVVQTTLDPMSFAAIDARLRDYNFGINEYMREHIAEATQKKVSGKTFNGVAAECTYTISPDGKYESLQMEKRLANGTQVDEYFNLGDAVFVARTTIYDDGDFDPVDKYYIIDGGLYKVDGSAETVTKLADINGDSGSAIKTELDIYFSFDEIRAIYA